jgi:PPK2 family polyphosphate:nucleotide phosphotransferase
MKIHPSDFRVPPGKRVRLKKWPTKTRPFYKSEENYRKRLESDVAELSEQQQLLDASANYAVLLIFQAMDAAGKDGVIRHVLTGVNPAGCEVFGFKRPSAEESAHDFLWRTTCRLPARGRIGVFNRSYYEEVLVARVHPELLGTEQLPPGVACDPAIWRHRFRSINDFERHLHRNGTRVIKFYLHLSKGEQRRRFLSRLDEPQKNWKFSAADATERRYWGKYMAAYEDCLNATSTKSAPWHVIPADDKLNARLIVSRIVIDTLRGLKLSFPKIGGRRRLELNSIRRHLSK